MVLVGYRCAKKGHDPVAHHLVDGAFVVMDGFHHPLEHGVKDLARFLGVTVGEQLHRTLEVSEEHGHLLALALKRGLRSQDPLGEVLGGVTGGNWAGRSRAPRQSRAARATEPLAGGHFGSTLRAREGEAGATVLAEARVCGVVSLAPRTPHRRSPGIIAWKGPAPSWVVLGQPLEGRLEQPSDLRVALPLGGSPPLPAPGGPAPAGAHLLASVNRGLPADGAWPGG